MSSPPAAVAAAVLQPSRTALEFMRETTPTPPSSPVQTNVLKPIQVRRHWQIVCVRDAAMLRQMTKFKLGGDAALCAAFGELDAVCDFAGLVSLKLGYGADGATCLANFNDLSNKAILELFCRPGVIVIPVSDNDDKDGRDVHAPKPGKLFELSELLRSASVQTTAWRATVIVAMGNSINEMSDRRAPSFSFGTWVEFVGRARSAASTWNISLGCSLTCTLCYILVNLAHVGDAEPLPMLGRVVPTMRAVPSLASTTPHSVVGPGEIGLRVLMLKLAENAFAAGGWPAFICAQTGVRLFQCPGQCDDPVTNIAVCGGVYQVTAALTSIATTRLSNPFALVSDTVRANVANGKQSSQLCLVMKDSSVITLLGERAGVIASIRRFCGDACIQVDMKSKSVTTVSMPTRMWTITVNGESGAVANAIEMIVRRVALSDVILGCLTATTHAERATAVTRVLMALNIPFHRLEHKDGRVILLAYYSQRGMELMEIVPEHRHCLATTRVQMQWVYVVPQPPPPRVTPAAASL